MSLFFWHESYKISQSSQQCRVLPSHQRRKPATRSKRHRRAFYEDSRKSCLLPLSLRSSLPSLCPFPSLSSPISPCHANLCTPLISLPTSPRTPFVPFPSSFPFSWYVHGFHSLAHSLLSTCLIHSRFPFVGHLCSPRLFFSLFLYFCFYSFSLSFTCSSLALFTSFLYFCSHYSTPYTHTHLHTHSSCFVQFTPLLHSFTHLFIRLPFLTSLPFSPLH